MEVEIQGMPQSIRQPYQARLRTAKNNMTRQKKQAVSAIYTYVSLAAVSLPLQKDLLTSASRAELLGTFRGSPVSDDPYGTSDRSRLLSGTAVLEEGSRRLEDSHRIALETESQGADILRNLRGQREQIENSRNMVRLLMHTR